MAPSRTPSEGIVGAAPAEANAVLSWPVAHAAAS
jgi:hypothetical protein